MSDDRREPTDGTPVEDAGPETGGTTPGPDQTQPFSPQSEPDETQPFNRRSEPDETQQFDPRSEPDETRAIDPWADPDRTRALGAGAGNASDPDRTRTFDAQADADPTRRMPGDATARSGRPDATARFGQPESTAWSGRAGVPPPRPAAGTAEPTSWGEYEPQGGRPWWAPILIGLVALLLLGVLAFAIWLLAESDDRDDPVAPSPSATAAEPSPTPAPTPTATTGRPTPSATSEAPVPVPPLVGLPVAEAQDLLEDLGLESRLEFRISDRPAGTVIDTDPGAGALISPGDTVTLVVVQPRPTPPDTATPSQPGPGPTTGSEG